MDSLYWRSIEIILQNQAASGAYVASPNFPTYQYSWFRDGAYIAYAMDLAGQFDSAGRFHDWAARMVNQRIEVIDRAVEHARFGNPLSDHDILHTRYTLDGSESGDKGWGNFQLDGFGTWLWVLGQHYSIQQGTLSNEIQSAAWQVARYLSALWKLPCYDCWEEYPDKIHTYTLAAIYGGLKAYQRVNPGWDSQTAEQIREFINENAIFDGYFVKYLSLEAVDASLLGLVIPYQLHKSSNPLVRKTVSKIEAELKREIGVHRYLKDTYYGGGAWLLLTAWLGWYYMEAGQKDKALECLAWIGTQADPLGQLPEQIPQHLNDPSIYPKWVERWGEIACPLLWSHAFYIVLWHKING